MDGDRGVVVGLQPTDAGADHHAGNVFLFLGPRFPAGILHRLRRRDDAVVDEAIHLLDFLDRDPFGQVKFPLSDGTRRHLAGNFGRQLRGVEGLNGADPGLSVDHPLPDMFAPTPQRADDSHTCHDNTAHANSLDGFRKSKDYSAFCFSIYSMASLTVVIFSAASSGISTPKA